MEIVVNPIDLPRLRDVKSDRLLKIDVGAKGVNPSGLWSSEERKGAKIRDWGKERAHLLEPRSKVHLW
jgi:hypothetical protein